MFSTQHTRARHKMDQTTLNNHYKNLAGKYDESYSKTTAAGESKTKYSFGGEDGARCIIELLDVREDDLMVDLGAGTCATAGMVARIAGLKHPVLCADPVQEMLNVAKKKKIANIETLCATAEEFAKKDMKYDKMLIKGAVHHFPVDKMKEIFSGIETQLNAKGVILIDKIGSNRTGGMPFFKKGIEFQRNMQEGLTKILEKILEDLGFKIDKKIINDEMKITKEEAIKYIKNKSISLISALSEEEIEEGIAEVEREYGDVISFRMTREMIIARK